MDKQNVMAGMPNNVGAIFRAPLGTPLPTDATTALDSAYKELGYASSDGWARQVNKSYNALNAWGGDEVGKARSEHSVGFNVTLIEDLNGDVQTAKWGTAAVTVTPANEAHGNLVTVTYEGEETDPAVWVFDMYDEGRLHRTVFPNAKDVTESFEQTFSDAEAVGLPFEMTAYRGPDGAYFVDYLDDGQKVVAGP
ncbi:MAG: hypothetical protein IPJ61_17600 [Tessaracoccus sp.]|uniref:phage tail tube protein n=1 Tax=Tessaracoccus sp. TaxID=1971211 RepID=UPI001ECE8EB5|nr:hypothetical protein [Tessaracoccus sp.]MBK7822820.1 hypothetical protein [Tessaracoccus sp.]